MRFRCLFVKLLMLVPLLGCAVFYPASSRKQMLQDDLRRFHVGLLSQNRAALVRPIRAVAREPWGKAWDCFFQRFRVVDYVVEEVRFKDEAQGAEVSVRVTGHFVNALSTRQVPWQEAWRYDKQRWRLDVETEAFREILGECFPEASAEQSAIPVP